MGTMLTAQQKIAVENKGGDLLVSAAAGSGKTKVLVERILTQIRDDNKNITDFVIITYTNKAAEELRAKIRAELTALVAENPNDKHLRNQLPLLYSANISTVHAYCAFILRENAATIGLSTDFRVMDERESRIGKAICMEDVIEDVYKIVKEGKDPELKAMVEQLAYGRDGDKALPAMVYHAYETIQAHTWPEVWVKESIAKLDVSGYTDIAQTPWGAFLMRNLQAYVTTQLPRVEAAISLLDRDEILSASMSTALVADRAKLRSIASARTWDELCDALNTSWERLKTPRAKKDGSTDFDVALKDAVKDMRDSYKKAVDTKCKPAMSDHSAGLLADIALTTDAVKGLFKMVHRFTVAYNEYKKTHSMLDFNDLEHKTIEMLIDAKTGKYTDIAKTLQNKYVGVYIDEYQDTNAVQETIFIAISNNNRFMVGDVKQSIYQFRLADPSIFLGHYNLFVNAETARINEPRKVLLTKNFRSREEILDATNAVMRTCMSPLVGGVEYTDEEALTCGKTFADVESDTAVELNVIDLASGNAENSDADDDGDDGLGGVLKADIESRFVAARIAKMLRDKEQVIDEETGEPRAVRASDFAIILRSVKNSAKHYEKALSDFGISCVTPKSESLLETTEGSTLFCLLQVLDNPQQDIPLVSVLASPLFGFTADDLAQVRIADKKARSFYAALQAAEETMPKAKAFLETLSALRTDALHMTLPQLYQQILERTDALDVFGSMPNGHQRMDNVNALGENIAAFAARGGQGLFRYIANIVEMREQGDDLDKPNITKGDDAVTITSVHSSKGLEYPIVILADMSRNFNMADLKDTVLMDAKLGVGVQVTDTVRKVRYPTIARTAIAMRMQEEAKSEELRILYVALTRAQQKLIMCYTDKNLRRVMQRLSAVAAYPLSATASQAVNSPGEWVLLTALTREEARPLHRMCDTLPELHNSGYAWNVIMHTPDEIGLGHKTLQELDAETPTDEEQKVIGEVYDTIDVPNLADDLAFQYPHMENISLQAKVVATELAHKEERTEKEITCRRPNFEQAATNATAAERGTATHMFMQFADYGKLMNDGSLGVEEELARLVNNKFIDAVTAKAVLTNAIEKLFESETGRELANMQEQCNATRLPFEREFPFSVLIHGSDLDENIDKDDSRALVMLQGVIDLFYIDKDNGIHIYDFKTDWVEDAEDMQKKADYYKSQLDVYERALLEIYGDGYHIAERALIFLRVGEKLAA